MTRILSEEVSPIWILTAIVVIAYTTVRYLRSPWRNLPPGPRGLPLIGNLLELRGKQWLTFTDLGKKYGDLMYFNVAGQPLVVLNSQKVAADLLDRRAGKFSDRPRNIVASDIMTGGNLVVFTRYGDVWRRMRKAAHEGLNKGVVYKYHPIQTAEAVLLTAGVLAEPEKWNSHLRRTAASAIMSMVYDTPPTSEQDPSVKNINEFVARLTRAAMPGAHFVEFFPWMRYIPSKYAKWKREAEESYAKDSAMFEGLFNGVKDRVAKGDERPSLASTLIQDAGRHDLTERENSWLAGTMYAAGAETTSGVMSWWTLAMIVYPETQKRAQAELDAVVGRDRLPSFADYEHLPYIRAMVKEALRWRMVDPVGLPHQSTEDDVYDGYFIPAGTILIANVWHLNRDPEIYGPDAEHFNPARHLDKNGKLAPGPSDTKEESHVTYGFGRRICVGRHVANNSLFIDIAMMLWAMNIERATDENGVPLPLDVDGCVEDGLVTRPVPFKAKITPRFREAQAIVEQERELLGYH
ncbi:related to O-methylsterigmatocystin oxidoreductase [Armillaria ostoyae]|uniref:Related to O-methylsterigmatocystin oxidoreductase n=1 Tax=Armillaria ostoyae TaxID=47428 RepID=A0A284RNF2_ARMOS|nr:related to O-methylsterigmatocystin oxidoreductase [Armillaria ostoyae]